MSELIEEPDWSEGARLVIGRLAFGAMAIVGIEALLALLEEDVLRLAFPLTLAPLLAVAALQVIPGRRAVIGSVSTFLVGFTMSQSLSDRAASLAIFCLIFSLILGQGGWWHILRRQPIRGLRSYDAAIFAAGGFLGIGILISGGWWVLFPAGLTVALAWLSDRHEWLISTVEKSFLHLNGALRVLAHDAWMRRMFGFLVLLSLTVFGFVENWASDPWNTRDPFTIGCLFIPFGLTLVPWVWKKIDRLDSKWLIGGSSGLLLLLNLPIWLYPVFAKSSLPVEVEFGLFLIAAFLLPLMWRRMVNEIATPLPHPIRYLAEPLILAGIGFSALVLYAGVTSLVGTVETELGAFSPPFLIWTLVLVTIAAFALGLPNQTYRRPDSDFKDVLFFPGQNPLVQLPRGADACVVTIAYWIPEDNQRAFEKILPAVGKVRRRAGALGWQVTQDPVEPIIWREHFTVDSWAEYADAIKLETPRDRELKQELFNLNDWESLPSEDHYPIRVT